MDDSNLTQEQREELFREFHGQQLRLQTKRLEQIHNYVAIWFWLTVVGVVLIVLMTFAETSGY